MLVLARDEGEGIKIGDHIVIKLLRCNGEIKVGINAPKNLRIVRLDPDGREEPRVEK